MKVSKKISILILMVMVFMMTVPTVAMAANTATPSPSPSPTMDDVDKETANLWEVMIPVVKLIENLVSPLLALVGACGSLFCVFLGVKFARADDPQEHEKAKKALKNAIIGFVLIFVLMLALKLAMPRLTEWVKKN